MLRLFFLLALAFSSALSCFSQKRVIRDKFGAIVRGDTTRKEIALVFTGDEFGEGGEIIKSILKKHQVHGSFFFTGKFYSNPTFKKLIQQLKKEGYYLGPHSDQHLLYADWAKRDSVLITEKEFSTDLDQNYVRMSAFGIKKSDARYFIPPYEWYNSTIAAWATRQNISLINFTPGTRSTADYTYPEMGKKYFPTDLIIQSILSYEENSSNGLNGFILLIHIGTDPRRKDKLYNQLDLLLNKLEAKNYKFLRIDELL